MKIKNIRIGRQLFFGLTMLLVFVLVLGVISYLQTKKIHDQITLMYNHPMQVRAAIDEVHTDVYLIHWALETALAKDGFEAMKPYLWLIHECEARMQKNFGILYDFYLGPREYIEVLDLVTGQCKLNRDQVFGFLRAGNFEDADKINIHKGSVIGGDHLAGIMEKVEVISEDSRKRAVALKYQSQELRDKLTLQLITIVAVFILLSLAINYSLLSNIRKPLINLTSATKKFANGDMNARSDYHSENEFGALSESFNRLAANIQNNIYLNDTINQLSDLMLSEDNAKNFFRITINFLVRYTHSQMMAIYLLNETGDRFEHYYSIGLNDSARNSFGFKEMEGEFGLAVADGKIERLKNIGRDNRFVFHAVAGDIIPSEMLTIPIISSGEVMGIISMASVNGYDNHVIEFVNKMHNALNARISGVLAYKKMTEFAGKLEEQNRELESQKSELFQQAAELGRQNMELELQKKQLDEANRLKTNFLSNMSHELRTPLNSVIALSGVLNRRLTGKIPQEEYSYISVIERNGKHLLSLINDILDISRIEAGKEEIELAKFNVCDHVDEVVSVIKPQADQKNLALSAASGDCEILINSDASKFRHILQNLVGNAVKFTEAGSVEVTVEHEYQRVRINVADTGIGIDEKNLKHIFEEFRQADGSTSRRFGGTGLGLAIAQKYANLLGGKITVVSTPRKGSVFTLTLPVEYPGPHVEYQTYSPQSAGFLKSGTPENVNEQIHDKTILLVEDSEPAIVQMKDILEVAGFNLIVAENGAKALQLISEQLPDAIILDLMMPEVDGFEVLKKLRENPKTVSIPVLILTAKQVTRKDLEFLQGNNIHQLIQKGDVNRNELLNAVAGMVITQDAEKVEENAIMPQPIKGKPLVLVVEDNHDNMLTVKALLVDNFDVIVAYTGREGVAMAAQHKPQLILMDIALPEMDGVEAFKEIRRNKLLQNIPVVALTASAMTGDREIILASGFNGYISKPIDEKVFFSIIKSVLYGNEHRNDFGRE
jgi:signal transduction histidine kinase/CheY-like chemotaxis protein/HAMP domain-containing protein